MAKAIAYTNLLATMLSLASAQTFEAASVKLNRSGRNPGSTSRSGGQLVFENTSLRECIAIAYGISPDRDYALTGPSWIDTERYDIVAKVPAETPRPQVLRMLQALLADRFQLRLHRENKEVRVYLLAVARTGAKLKAVPGPEDSFTFRPGHISVKAQSMDELANKLSRPIFGLGAPVINSTGLRAFSISPWIGRPTTCSRTGRPSSRRYGSNWGSNWKRRRAGSKCWRSIARSGSLPRTDALLALHRIDVHDRKGSVELRRLQQMAHG